MPRLHHLADANPFDYWDSFAIRGSDEDTKALVEGRMRLFEAVRVDPPALDRSNLPTERLHAIRGSHGSALSGGDTSMIQNVYARTNVLSADWISTFVANTTDRLRDAVISWSHAVTVTLFIGEKPMRRWPLYNLLSRKPGDRPADSMKIEEASAYFDELAKALYDGYRATASANRELASSAWEVIGEGVKKPWRGAAHAAHEHLKSPQLLIVPPRQTVEVVVQADAHALGQFVELVDPQILPAPMVWVHLEGFQRRDVC